MENVENNRFVPWLIGVVVALVVSAFHYVGMFERFDYVFHDYFLEQRGPVEFDDRVLLVDVDDSTFNAFGWPMERGLYANLLMLAHKHGAKVVGFDVLFLDESRWGEEDDLIFGQAVKSFGPVILPYDYQVFTPPKVSPESGLYIADVSVAPLAKLVGEDSPKSHLKADNHLDGVVRHVPVQLDDGSINKPWTLSLAMMRAAHPDTFQADFSEDVMRVSGWGSDKVVEIPLSDSKNANVYFKTAEPEKTVVSLLDVLAAAQGENKELDLEDTFRDKYVMVGVSAAALGDRGAIPLANDAALTIVHAHMLDNLLTDSFVKPLRGISVFLLFLSISCAISILSLRGRVLPSTILCWSIFGAICLGAYQNLMVNQILVPLSGPMMAIIGSSLGANLYRRFIVEKQERFVREVFGRFVSPDVLEQLVNEPADMKLQGRRRHVSVLFSDIVGYTTLSNSLTEMEIVYLLRDYLDPMSSTILKHGGTVDKIMGDGIMAFFGDPVDEPKHELKAVQCAVEMHRELDLLNERLAKEGRSQLSIRVGIATGTVYSGNFGSDDRIEYTVIGQAVNLAARLESKAREGTTLISAETYKAVRGTVSCRLVNKIALKGYSELQNAYEVLPPGKLEALKKSEENLRKYTRLELTLPVQVELDGWILQGEVVNISAGGIFIRVGQSFPVGTNLRLSLSIPVGSREVPLTIEGEVVHVLDGEDADIGMGLQFSSLRSTERQGLQELLSLLLGECEDLLPLVQTEQVHSGKSEFEVTAADFVAPELTLDGIELGGKDAIDKLDNL